MSLIPTIPRSSFRVVFTNQAGPSTTPGTSVTPGASGSEGSATVIATGAQITSDIVGLYLWITGGATSTASKIQLLDVGYDPAGGTSYQWVGQNIEIGGSGTAAQGGIDMFLPLFIPAGSQVAVRIQGGNATAGTVRVAAQFYGGASRPENTLAFRKSETIGTITSSSGVAVTPGTSAAEGSWVLIGATTFRWRYCLPSFQLDDASTNAQQIYFDVAYGTASNKVIIAENVSAAVPGTAEATCVALASSMRDFWCNIPSGVNIYVRCSTTLATADSNYDFLVTGFG
jgi:hypothetical protein